MKFNKKNEGGAIVIEASISLVVYIFAIFTVLTILDIANTQAKIGIALNSSTKQFSEYSYFYYLARLDDFKSKIGKGSMVMKEGFENITSTYESLEKLKNYTNEDISEIDLESLEKEIDNIKSSGKSSIDFGKKSLENPKVMLEYFASSLATKGINKIEERAIGYIIKNLMEKNLKDFEDDNSQDFLKRHRVEPTFDFKGSQISGLETKQLIVVKIKYKIKVFDFFKFDINLPIEQKASTYAWSLGVEN